MVVAVAAWPAVASAVAALDEQWNPTGDWAVLNLRVTDVGRLTPLVGPYSRFGWNHPGPLLYWLLAVPYHLLGDRPAALLAATGLLNAVVVAAVVALGWRRGGLPLLLATGAAMAVLTHSMGPALLRDPWNPYVTLLPLVLLAFLAWSVAEGDRWLWPALIGVGSFLVQSHVGYVVMVVAVGAVAAGLAWGRRGAVPLLPVERRARCTLLALTVGIAVVAWAPVVLDQVAGRGNARDIVTYFASSDDTPAGFGLALDQAALQLALPDAPWLGDVERAGPDGAIAGASLDELAVPMVVFGLALMAAGLARLWSAVRFQAVVGVLVLSGVVATSRITGPVFEYLVRWWWVMACLWWLSSLWSVGCALVHWARLPRPARAALPWLASIALAATVVVTSGRTAGAADTAPVPAPAGSEVLGHLLRPTVDALRGSGPVLVVSWGSIFGGASDGIRLELERNGIEVVSQPHDTFRLGDERSPNRRPPVATVWVVSADAATLWLTEPGVVRLAGWDPLLPPERAAYLAEEAVLRSQLVAAGRADLAAALPIGAGGLDSGEADLPGVDQDLLARVEAIRRQGDPVAIYLGPPSDPDDPSPPSEGR